MAHYHLHEPAPCSHWPEELLQEVGATYREARGEGLKPLACLDRAEAVYIAAGGLALDTRDVVVSMIASLSAERGELAVGTGTGVGKPARHCRRSYPMTAA